MISFEIPDQQGDDSNTDPCKPVKSIGVLQKRHVSEVHTIHTGNEVERNENGRKNGQHLHDAVHLIGQFGHIGLIHVFDRIHSPAQFDQCLIDVVLNIF